jgi:hypothetical protein
VRRVIEETPMPEPIEPNSMLPITPNPPPDLSPVADELRASTGGGPTGVGNVLDVVGVVLEGVTSDAGADVASAAIEVGGEVLGGAMEALGSGFEVVGGCAEGCSLMIALVLLLAAAGSAMAFGLF